METRNIRDFIHLYLGCECITYGGKIPVSLIGIVKMQSGELKAFVGHEHNTYYVSLDMPEYCRPILRLLSDMTEEEAKEFLRIDGITAGFMSVNAFGIRHNHTTWEFNPHGEGMPANPNQFAFLLSKGFDLFNLIPDGLAIDKTKLSNQ